MSLYFTMARAGQQLYIDSDLSFGDSRIVQISTVLLIEREIISFLVYSVGGIDSKNVGTLSCC